MKKTHGIGSRATHGPDTPPVASPASSSQELGARSDGPPIASLASPSGESTARPGGLLDRLIPNGAQGTGDPKGEKPAKRVGPVTPTEETAAAAWVAQGRASPREFLPRLSRKLRRAVSRQGQAYLLLDDRGNAYALRIGSGKANALIAALAAEEGIALRKRDIVDINELQSAEAERSGLVVDVWNRVAPIDGGIEIDLGTEDHARVRITPARVEVIREGSGTLFWRSPIARPMCIPTQVGDLRLIKRHLRNLHPVSIVLFIGWLSYTLAHAKVATTNYVHLHLLGGQGSGKSTLCRLILELLDPSLVGLQALSTSVQDLAIAAQNAHVLIFDNVRHISHKMSDWLCIVATGGAFSTRQLYTDAGQ
jgi:hypothetical protein